MVSNKLFARTTINRLGLLLLIAGAVGFLASFILTVDKFKLLQNPGYIPSCNISPIISCGSVMKTSQASVFGFTNSLIGMAAFAGVVTLGLVLLAGAKLQKWLWQLIQGASILGLVFAHWLIIESIFRLHTICPYCVAVWIVTILIAWYVTIYNVRSDVIPGVSKSNPIVRFVLRHHGDTLALWYLIIIGVILNRFWYYWQTLI